VNRELGLGFGVGGESAPGRGDVAPLFDRALLTTRLPGLALSTSDVEAVLTGCVELFVLDPRAVGIFTSLP
jgi:hypothetical protein